MHHPTSRAPKSFYANFFACLNIVSNAFSVVVHVEIDADIWLVWYNFEL
jgi:hypothetical protein